MDYSTWQTVSGITGLIIFVSLFVGVVAYALWPKNKAKFDHAAHLPLSDDSKSNTIPNGGSRG